MVTSASIQGKIMTVPFYKVSCCYNANFNGSIFSSYVGVITSESLFNRLKPPYRFLASIVLACIDSIYNLLTQD